MNTKRRVHDSIVGLLITLGIALGYWVAPVWLILPGVVGVLLIQSGFTGFCPVYFVLDRMHVGEKQPAGTGSIAA